MPKHTPIRKNQASPSIDDIRSYFGVTGNNNSWALGGDGTYQNTRELTGQMTGPVDIAAARGVAHTHWAGLDEIPIPGGGVWEGDQNKVPPNPGNWRRGRFGWPNNDSQGSSVTSNSGLIDIYHEKENLDAATSVGIKGYFKATLNQTYNYIIQWECLESQGHVFADQGKQPQTVYAGFASHANGYQDGAQTVYTVHEEIGVNPINFGNNTRTWTGSLTAPECPHDSVHQDLDGQNSDS